MKKTNLRPAVAVPSSSPLERAASSIERHSTWIALALVFLATLRIVATYHELSFTFDEPAHIACGMEWLEKHTYTLEPQHPPLARVMTALLPRLFGAHGANHRDMTQEGIAILSQDGKLDRNLALARAGVLPFFWIACWVAFLFARRVTESASAAVLTVFLLTMTPAVLAHAGLATTDMGLTAMLLAAIYSGWRWLDEPTMRRAIWFGAALALAILTKFSTLAFFPMVAAVAIAGRWWPHRSAPKDLGRRALQLLATSGVALALIWAGYWFSFGPAPYVSFPVPAPELLRGIRQVQEHNQTGHLTYLLGRTSTTGWWYFYLVALGVKTPLPILGLGLIGLALLARKQRGWIVPATVLGILIYASLLSRIQIGTRHVMPVYVALCIGASCAVLWLIRRYPGPAIQYALAALALWVGIGSLAAHPDYLGYFNAFAGSKPEAILVDSDLDWGQDMKRLGAALRAAGAREVWFNQMEPGNMVELYGFPPIRQLDVNGPQPGWNAVSLTPLMFGRFGETRYVYDPGFQFWPEKIQPTERIGTGTLLFYSAGR